MAVEFPFPLYELARHGGCDRSVGEVSTHGGQLEQIAIVHSHSRGGSWVKTASLTKALLIGPRRIDVRTTVEHELAVAATRRAPDAARAWDDAMAEIATTGWRAARLEIDGNVVRAMSLKLRSGVAATLAERADHFVYVISDGLCAGGLALAEVPDRGRYARAVEALLSQRPEPDAG